MKKSIYLTSLFLAACCMGVSAKKPKKIQKEQQLTSSIDEKFSVYDNLQKSIWGYAELGFLEEQSSKALQDELAANGFTIDAGVAKMPTAFVATYGEGKPVIGILAEFDALGSLSQDTVAYIKPLVKGGSGHGCGHNLLGTAAVAGAISVAEWMKETGTPGTIKVYGAPAEEGGGGKTFLSKEGLFDGVDAVLDWHPGSSNGVSGGSSLARLSTIYSFHGTSSHAGGSPEKGRSALDAVECMNYMVNMMREHMSMDSRIHYVITDGGGISPNVVPNYAQVSYYVRAKSIPELMELAERVDKCANAAALGTETTVDIQRLGGATHPKLPNKALTMLIYDKLQQVGAPQLDEREIAFAKALTGTTRNTNGIEEMLIVQPFTENDFGKLGHGSSDVGDVSWNAPVGSFSAACFVPGSGGHSWQNVAAGGSTLGTKGVITAGKVFALTAAQILTDPSLLEPMQEEFISELGAYNYKPIVADKDPELDYRKTAD